MKLTEEMVATAYYQATNLLRDTKEIIARLTQELNKAIEIAEDEERWRKEYGPK